MRDAPDFTSYLNNNYKTTFRSFLFVCFFVLIKRKQTVTHRAEKGLSKFNSLLWDRYVCILSQPIHASVYSWLLERE